MSRLLSSEILSLSYVFDIDVDCSAAGCNVASISEALQDAATQDLNGQGNSWIDWAQEQETRLPSFLVK